MKNVMRAVLFGVALLAGACGPMDDPNATGAGLGTSAQALSVNDFQVGINAYDEHLKWFTWVPDTGATRWTPSVGTILAMSSPGVSDWASDDHDNWGLNAMQIWISKSLARLVLDGYDIRIGIAVKDGTAVGPVKYTPWLSEVQQLGVSGWSVYAGDGQDNLGLDYAQVYLDVRPYDGFILNPHFRLGICVWDGGAAGTTAFTPYMDVEKMGALPSGYSTYTAGSGDLDMIRVYIGP